MPIETKVGGFKLDFIRYMEVRDPALSRMDKIRKSREDTIRFFESAPVEIPEKGVIAGITEFDPSILGEEFTDGRFICMGDNFHFPMGMGCLKYGIKGTAELAASSMGGGKIDEENLNLEAIHDVYEAFSRYAMRYVDVLDKRMQSAIGGEKERLETMRGTLAAIAHRPAETFLEAVQLFYFVWRMRSIICTSTIGRLDQHLYPFYKSDIEAGRITKGQAHDIIFDLWKCLNDCGTGDTMLMIITGGSDVNGQDVTNDLSVMMIDVTREIGMSEPQLSARIHKNSREDFKEAVAKLQLMGGGQGSVYYDELIISELMKAGIPREDAHNYSLDGCSEIVIDNVSSIIFEQTNAVKIFEAALYNGEQVDPPGEKISWYWSKHTGQVEWDSTVVFGYRSGDVENAATYEEVYDAFMRQYKYQLDQKLDYLKNYSERLKVEGVTAPFMNGTMERVLTSGKDMLRGGLKYECLMLFSGSIPTVADGLAALKKVVFEEKKYTMKEVLSAMRANFEGHEDMRQELVHAPKYGNDDDYVDRIAADIANFFCDYVMEYNRKNGMLIWVSLYNFLYMQEATYTGATPDGRKFKDPIAVHMSPTTGRALKGPTAAINSAGKTAAGQRLRGESCLYILSAVYGAKKQRGPEGGKNAG
jgi:formate C-acetyltransferase